MMIYVRIKHLRENSDITQQTLADYLNVSRSTYKNYENGVRGKFSYPYSPTDVFMGFHCGNTAACMLKNPEMKHQLIMKRSLEPDSEPDITRGTLEGQIKPGKITIFRLQSTADAKLTSYAAQGEVVDADPKSFGGIGIFAIPEMGRFYRHVLIAKNYPHHTGVAFSHVGKILFDAMKLIGVCDVSYNQPASLLYKSENPFA